MGKPVLEMALRLGDAAERVTGITKAELFGPGRPARVAVVRQLVFFLLREVLHFTQQEAAEALNRTNHATVYHACRKVDFMLRSEARLPEGEQHTRRLLRAIAEAAEIPTPSL